MKTYAETLDFLYTNLPMYQRIGAAAYKADLHNTIAFCKALGSPEKKFKSIHIAGTNGKGSTSHLLASVLQAAGYKTGLYTSPHLKDFTERIRINGQEIPQHHVVDFVNRIKDSIDQIKPSFFEITVAMAYDYFASQKVDIAVIEVGLGGRLDSTNVITPLISIITNISYDHKELLGDTLPKIAYEKAGIIKSDVPVVVSERQEEVESVFRLRAAELKSPIYFADDDYRAVINGNDLAIESNRSTLNVRQFPLTGSYQERNIPGVMKTIELLQSRGFEISASKIVEGFQQVTTKTGLKGRWQILSTKPLLVCDTGHNEAGIREVVKQLSRISYNQLFMIIGAVNDKDLSSILSQLPQHAQYLFCQAKIPRALPADKLAALASALGLKGEIIEDVNEAIQAARKLAKEDDVIFVGGSTFVVAEIENL